MAETHSVYNLGAKNGLTMGIVLAGMFLCQTIGQFHSMALSWLGFGLVLAIPVVAFYILYQGYKASGYKDTFSAIWLHGIVMFLCGSLIMGLVAYLYMRLIKPDLITAEVNLLIDAYRAVDDQEAIHIADTLQKMIDKHLLPSPISFAFSLIWLVSFAGAMLSLVLALIIKAIR